MKPKGKIKKHSGLTTKQAKFLKGKAAGKNDKNAALDAGYAPSTANRTRQIWSEHVENEFQRLMRTAAPASHLVKKIRKHIDGKNAVASLKAIELAVEYSGLIPESAKDSAPGSIHNHYNFLTVESANERINELTERVRARLKEPARLNT